MQVSARGVSKSSGFLFFRGLASGCARRQNLLFKRLNDFNLYGYWYNSGNACSLSFSYIWTFSLWTFIDENTAITVSTLPLQAVSSLYRSPPCAYGSLVYSVSLEFHFA